MANINININISERINKLCFNTAYHTYLLSYPKSGNTWLRYCLEFLTHRASFSLAGIRQQMQRPLGWITNFEIDETKPPILKVHRPTEIKQISNNDKLVFILRNPKETIAKYERKTFDELLKDYNVGRNYKASIYFDDLEYFDKWSEENKLLVYYEDLILKPKETLSIILKFLNEPETSIDLFMQDYEKHKKTCIDIYEIAESRGDDILYHSQKLSLEYRQQVDIWISEKYPELWTTYLYRYKD